MSLAKGISQLIADSDYIAATCPRSTEHFENFPNDPVPGVEDHLHWFVEDFGYRPGHGHHSHGGLRAARIAASRSRPW